tara:strand:- start:395 stop:823 length:429 start_codon:yes stop_codon:yes gene_type:complete
MKYVFYILYRYYSTRKWEDTPFSQTVFILGTMLFLNLFTVAVALGIREYIAKNGIDSNLIPVTIIVVYTIIIAVLYIFIKQKDMARPEYYKRYKSRHGWLMALYVIISITMLPVVAMSMQNPKHRKAEFPPDEIIYKEIRDK